MKDYKNKFFFSFLTLLSLFFFASVTLAGQENQFNKIIIFGDSLSDNGNLFTYDFGFLPKSPPYFDGRFSNGMVWADIFANYFYNKNSTTSVNFAIGGETAILHDPTNGFLPYSLTMSVDSYLLRSILSDRSKTLFIIWIGSNDYLRGATDVDWLTTKVIENIQYSIERLIYYGGLNFLIINLPDIAKSPFGRKSAFKETLHDLTMMHNAKLKTAVSLIQNSYKKINIQLYDISTVFEKLVADPDVYNKKYNLNLVNVTGSCWDGNFYLKKNKVSEESLLKQLHERIQLQSKSLTNQSMPIRHFNQEGFAHLISTSPALREAYIVTEKNNEGIEPCSNPNGYVFWDKLHPSAVMHVMLSRGFIEFVEQHYSSITLIQ